jgi:hypothetical protein
MIQAGSVETDSAGNPYLSGSQGDAPKQQIVNDQLVTFGPGVEPSAQDIPGLRTEGEKPTIEEDVNGRSRWVGGPDHGKFVFPDTEVAPDLEKNLQNEAGLRKEFNTLLKDFNLVSDAYSRVNASASNPSAAGDLSLIFNFMKMLDPGSTVREGEFATAQNASGVPGRIVSAYNNILRGERMNDDQRADFVNRSNKLFESATQQAQKTADAYTIIGNNAGLNVENIIANFTARKDASAIPPPPPGFNVVGGEDG